LPSKQIFAKPSIMIILCKVPYIEEKLYLQSTTLSGLPWASLVVQTDTLYPDYYMLNTLWPEFPKLV